MDKKLAQKEGKENLNKAAKNSFLVDCAIADFWGEIRPQPYKSFRKKLTPNELSSFLESVSEEDEYQEKLKNLQTDPEISIAQKNSETILLRISDMDFSKLLVLWHNCLAAKTQKKSPANRELKKVTTKRHQARIILSAIDNEWERRTLLDPEDGEYFKWPTTDVSDGDGSVQAKDWLKEGMLQVLGYKVGRTAGIGTETRHQILHQVFSGSLPPAFPRSYIQQWSVPNSAARLKKMAETIAAFVRNSKRRRDQKMVTAVEEWEEDLKFLYDNFYAGKFRFGWPSSNV
jgi:hypothetical protein